ncbi:unnamed protein product [Ambrosiozyma monospora]|uniref:Unnamed protein product n=1 Tax=Ambrosiozyma monospora TaxID=43982 RepID=A0A9W6Z842_AMBMO|nr:unnamed protein product [Ambrosiozyma monospora]
MSFFTNFKKSFRFFQEARKRFDRWQLESFDIDGFERVLYSSSSGGSGSKGVDELVVTRRDFNLRLLCNSILLLSVKPHREDFIFRYLYKVLQNLEDEIFVKYPEIWRFVLIKLNYHNLLNDDSCRVLFNLYFTKCEPNSKFDPLVLDLLLTNVNSFEILFEITGKSEMAGFDDVTLSKYISKLYKLSKTFRIEQANSSDVNATASNTNRPVDAPPVSTPADSKNFADFMLSDLMQSDRNENKHFVKFTKRSEFRYPGFENAVDLARHLYISAKFKSSKLNSSFLLGEAIVEPQIVAAVFNDMNKFTKATPTTISALFVAALRLKELGLHDETVFEMPDGEQVDAIDYATRGFDEYVCQALGDDTFGKVYPTDTLLSLYIKSIGEFKKRDLIYGLLQRLVDLRFNFKLELFQQYLKIVPTTDRLELINCLNEYHQRFEKLRQCKSEFELTSVKRAMQSVYATGEFNEFVENLEVNWDVVRTWNWPGKS